MDAVSRSSHMEELYAAWHWEQDRRSHTPRIGSPVLTVLLGQYEIYEKFRQCYHKNRGAAGRLALDQWEEDTYILRMQLRDVRLRLVRIYYITRGQTCNGNLVIA